MRTILMYSNACLWWFRIRSPLSCSHTLTCSSAVRCLVLAAMARDSRSHSHANSTPNCMAKTRSTANNRGEARARLSYRDNT
uniref:Uncharacterized protein n=1 Tax=Esox lucius TaxID=8010 RepID=A0A3P9A7I5_ESOLU